MTPKKKTKIIAVAAITIDGKIARDHEHLTDWTSKEDKEFLHEFLDTCDAVVVGRTTYELAQAPLSKRNCIVLTGGVSKIQEESSKLLLWNPAGASVETIFEPYKKVALLGGSQTYSYFLEQDWIDEYYLTIEPIIFGSGLNLFDGEVATQKVHLVFRKLINQQGTMLLHYRRMP